MGQKVNPISFRLALLKGWKSKWCVKSKYSEYLHEDLSIRSFIKKRLRSAEVGKIEFVRYPGRLTVNIFTSRPGLIIGKKGSDIEILRKSVQKMTSSRLNINIIELRDFFINASLVSSQIAKQIEAKVSYKRVMKQAIGNALKAGVDGVKISLSGRLGGAEMAKQEVYKEGRVPLHTLRSQLDYGFAEAFTSFGVVGVKVWFCKGLAS